MMLSQHLQLDRIEDTFLRRLLDLTGEQELVKDKVSLVILKQ